MSKHDESIEKLRTIIKGFEQRKKLEKRLYDINVSTRIAVRDIVKNGDTTLINRELSVSYDGKTYSVKLHSDGGVSIYESVRVINLDL